jgi:hypothetical protein
MPTYSPLRNVAAVVNVKIAALALVMFVCGLTSGFILLQYSMRNTDRNVSQEALDMFGQHFWGGNNWTEAAIVVVNIGEKDVALTKITILGIEINWSSIYYWKTDSGPVSGGLNSTSGKLSGISSRIAVDGTDRNFQQATNELTLQTYWTIVLYVRNPAGVRTEDVPQKVTIAVFTQNKMYYKEADSEVTFTFIGTEQLTIPKIRWTWNSAPASRTFKIYVNNTGTKDVTINQILVNYAGVTGTITPALPYILKATQSVAITVTYGYTNGTNYDISVATSSSYKYTNTFTGGTDQG